MVSPQLLAEVHISHELVDKSYAGPQTFDCSVQRCIMRRCRRLFENYVEIDLADAAAVQLLEGFSELKSPMAGVWVVEDLVATNENDIAGRLLPCNLRLEQPQKLIDWFEQQHGEQGDYEKDREY